MMSKIIEAFFRESIGKACEKMGAKLSIVGDDPMTRGEPRLRIDFEWHGSLDLHPEKAAEMGSGAWFEQKDEEAKALLRALEDRLNACAGHKGNLR